MSTTQDLFHLIKGMTKAEKRYFRVFARKFSEKQEQDYLTLYNKINKLAEPEDEVLQKKLNKHPAILKKLPVLKNYLYHALLDSLRNFHQEKNIDQTLYQILEDISILFEKDLNDQIFKLIKKGKKLAEKYEKYEHLLILNNWEILILHRKKDTASLQKYLELNYPQQKDYLRKIENQIDFQKLQAELISLKEDINYIRTSKDEKAYQKIMGNPLLKDEKGAFTFDSRHSFYNAHGLYQRIKGNLEESCKKSGQLLELFDSLPHLKTDRSVKYLVAVNNQIGTLMDQGKYEEALSELKRLDEIKEKGRLMDREIFMLENRIKAIIYTECGQYQKGLQLQTPIMKGLKKYEGSISLEWISDFYHEQALFNLMAENFENAIDWVNTMLDILPRKQLIQKQSNARIIDFMIRYDVGDDLYLENAIRSTHRFLNSRERLYDFEKLVLKFLNTLLYVQDQEGYIINLKWLDQELEELKKNPNEFLVMNNYKFPEWIKSKLENISFATSIRKNVEIPESFL